MGIDIPSVELNPGSIVDVPIKVSQAPNFLSGLITLQYDPLVLTPIDVKTTDLSSNHLLAHSSHGEFLTISLAGSSPITGSGTLAVVRFNVFGEATSGSMPFSIISAAFDEGVIPVVLGSGTSPVDNDGDNPIPPTPEGVIYPLFPAEGESLRIMQGGTAVGYVRITGIDGNPIPGAKIELDDIEEFFESDEQGIAAIRIPWNRIGSGQVGESKAFRIPNSDISIHVEVEKRVYGTEWISDGYGRLGISFVNVDIGAGTSILLENTQGKAGTFDAIEIGRQSMSGAGAEFKASASIGMELGNVAGHRIGGKAGAEAGVEGMIRAIREDRYRFSYPERTTREAMIQYALLGEGLIGLFSPELLNLLSFVEGRLARETILDQTYVFSSRGMDVMMGASASAQALGGVFGNKTTVGLQVEAGVGGEGHGRILWSEYPRESLKSLLIGISGKGKAYAGATAGVVVSGIGAGAFAGAQAAGELGGSVEVLFEQGLRPACIELQATGRGEWGYNVGAGLGQITKDDPNTLKVGISRGKAVETISALRFEGVSDALEELVRSDPIAVRVLGDNPGNISVSGDLLERMEANLLKGLEKLTEAGRQLTVTYEQEVATIEHESGGNIINLHGELTSALRVKLAADKKVEHRNGLIVERGRWIAGWLRPTELYQIDEFVEFPDQTMASVIQEVHDDMREIVAEAFTMGVIQLVQGATKVIEWGESKLEIAADALGGEVQEIQIAVWSWFGPSNSSSLLSLGTGERRARAKIAKLAQQVARLDYGIGGFYRLEPSDAVLSQPAVLTISYTDEEIIGIDETFLATYRYDEETGEWVLVTSLVVPDSNIVRASISKLGTYTLAPRIPAGEFDIHPDTGSLPADGASSVSVKTDTIFNNDGTQVDDGTLLTLFASSGAIISEDLDSEREGVQLTAKNGRVEFLFQAGLIAAPAEFIMQSVSGTAIGRGTLELTDAKPPSTPHPLTARWDENTVQISWYSIEDVDIGGYVVYFRENEPGPPWDVSVDSLGTSSPVTVGTDTTASLSGLNPEKTYFFAISAVDIAGNESMLSDGFTITESILTADWDGNGTVDFGDFFLFVDHFGSTNPDDSIYDLDASGIVDFGDFFIFVDQFGSSRPKLLALAEQYLHIPLRFVLHPNYPNPFNMQTTLSYQLPYQRSGEDYQITIDIFDLLGRRVRTLFKGSQPPGDYLRIWDGRDSNNLPLASGIFIFRVKTDQWIASQKAILLK
ncbi:hypothetical protein HN588_07705 [Candidatus Bathyarchaeota archaeon]|nr:hypothetical protein [Candidatus Bathyarchaeota archaeon]